jgi:ABC-type transporter lipoprotein component MlaA
MTRGVLVVVTALAALLYAPPAIASDGASDGGAVAAQDIADETPDYDPWHAFNERTFWFNYYLLDKHVMKPIAHAWHRVLPDRVQQGIANFSDNL